MAPGVEAEALGPSLRRVPKPGFSGKSPRPDPDLEYPVGIDYGEMRTLHKALGHLLLGHIDIGGSGVASLTAPLHTDPERKGRGYVSCVLITFAPTMTQGNIDIV